MSARCREQTVITDTTSGNVVRLVKMEVDFTETMTFSGNGGVLSAADSAHIKVINLSDGEFKEVGQFNIGHTIDLNHNGALLAEGGGWKNAAIKITEVATGKTYRMLEGHPGIINALAFSPAGSSLASGGSDRVIRFWDSRSGSISASFYGHQRSINALAFNPQGNLLVSSSQDETMNVWDLKSGALLRTIDVRDDGIWGVNAMSFSPDGKSFVSGGHNGSLKVWDTGLWKTERSLLIDNDEVGKAMSVVFSPDGKQILSGHEDGKLRLWDVRTGRLLRAIKSGGMRVRGVFTPDGKMVVAVNSDDNPVRIIDARRGAIIRAIGKEDELNYIDWVAINPDGKTLAVAESGGDVSLWNIRSGKLVIRFTPGDSYSDDDIVAFSPDGKTLAAGGLNQNILLWELKSGHLQWSLLPLRSKSKEEIEADEERARQVAILNAERERRKREAEADAATWKGKVRISFESYGEPADLMSARLAEPAKPYQKQKDQSVRTASGVWLRLRNDSPLPITFTTVSSYLNRGAKCGYTTAAGRFFEGLCDGTMVNIRYEVQDARGKPVPWGLDFGAISMLPPGASIVFSVKRDHLENGRSIRILYRYQKEDEKRKLEDYGSEYWVYFKASDLPR
jgi:WD40 repeat protein